MPTTKKRTAIRMAPTAKGEPPNVSPKVAIPALVLLGLGVLLVVVAVLPLGLDNDVQNTLLTAGIALVTGGGVTGGAGYAAPIGKVEVRD